jgi:hypothetical protein
MPPHRRFRFRPECESLEAVTLLSAAPVAADVHAMALHLNLKGTAVGTVTTPVSIPDTGQQYVLSKGAGTIAPLGSVTVNGSVRSTGFIAQGRARGVVTLADSKGSVTVALIGPLQKGFASLPTTFGYVIIRGTGSFQGATGRGVATLHFFTAVTDPLPCPPNAMCAPLGVGRHFNLTFVRSTG